MKFELTLTERLDDGKIRSWDKIEGNSLVELYAKLLQWTASWASKEIEGRNIEIEQLKFNSKFRDDDIPF